MDKKKIGEKIRTLRESAGMSQTQLAEAIDVSQSTIAKLETATRELSGLDNAMKVAEFFGVSAAWMLFDNADIDNLSEDAIRIAIMYDRMSDDERAAASVLFSSLSKSGDSAENQTTQKTKEPKKKR
jgi:transcriptional regulator with XRE-family HTH domain